MGCIRQVIWRGAGWLRWGVLFMLGVVWTASVGAKPRVTLRDMAGFSFGQITFLEDAADGGTVTVEPIRLRVQAPARGRTGRILLDPGKTASPLVRARLRLRKRARLVTSTVIPGYPEGVMPWVGSWKLAKRKRVLRLVIDYPVPPDGVDPPTSLLNWSQLQIKKNQVVYRGFSMDTASQDVLLTYFYRSKRFNPKE